MASKLLILERLYRNAVSAPSVRCKTCIILFVPIVAVLYSALAFSGSAASTSVNRTVPKVSRPVPLQFSSPPTDSEFLHTGLFAEPLAPVAITSPEENRALAAAILAYNEALQKTGSTDDVEPILSFINSHARSPWKPALQLNLGMIYRQTGHFSKALATWQAGWSDAQALSDPEGRALANAILGRLSQMESYLGRTELLQPLLASIQGRPIGGAASQMIMNSHTGLYNMTYHPDRSFRCGPLALSRILTHGYSQPSPIALRVLNEAASTDHGLSLASVQATATKADMHYQMAFRATGAPLITPAVVHWKVGHYAALVERDTKGRYLVQDSTFLDEIRVSPATLEEESSGYFLIPAGPLPPGWRPVSVDEGEHIWGRGDVGLTADPGATGASSPSTPNCNPDGGCTTAGIELVVLGLQLHDAPVGYTPPVGPAINFDMYYSHRDTQQPATFSYTNFGPKWTFTWLSYVTDSVNSSASALIYNRGGGNEPFTFSGTSATTSYPGPYSQTILTRAVNAGGASTGFTLTYPDGSYEQFDEVSGSQFFLTAVSDPAGNVVTLTYDSSMRIVAITDAIGQVSTLSYGLSGSPLIVTKITDPFGRSATFSYNGSGLLASITDTVGITSSYTYGQGSDPDFINTLTTPYGSTAFTYGDSSTNPSLGMTRFLTTVDPLNRKSYAEFSDTAVPGDSNQSGILIGPAPAGVTICPSVMVYRNTFTFDASQYALATATGNLNYTMGKVIQWMSSDHGGGGLAFAVRAKAGEKEPLENRVWYNYPSPPPNQCVDGGPLFGVDAGNVVASGASVQPSIIARVVDGGSTQLQTFQYNSSGRVTQTTDAVGRQWTYTYAANGIDRLTASNTTNSASQLLETRTYNGIHLPLTITGANGKTTHYQYNAAGQTTRVTDALGNATKRTFDSEGHLKSIQGPIASSLYTMGYDNVSRISAVTDPAGRTVRYSYDAADRRVELAFPDGTTARLAYTLLDLTSSTDRLGQTTEYHYDADRELTSTTDPDGNTRHFGYSAAGMLDSITDGNGHTTTFSFDLQNRLTSKQFANGTSDNIAYQDTQSLVAATTDALSQTTSYTYNLDNSIATVSYSAIQQTPNVSFIYDSSYPRLMSMTDGNGTTTYTYMPIANTPTLGANLLSVVSSPVAGTSLTDSVSYSYDALNRVISTNVNGNPQSVGFDALGRIVSASNSLDTFTYGYSDGTSRVTGVSSNTGPASAMTYFGPTGDELLEQLNVTTHSGGTSLDQFGYTYNADDNIKTFSISAPSSQTSTYAYDPANRLLSALVGTGSPQYAYAYDHASNLTSITPNGATQTFGYSSTNSISSGTYDANGSPTLLGGVSYKWDGANRIVRFVNSAAGASSSFTYDGLGRLVRVVDSSHGAITADRSFTWCNFSRCLAHDNTQSGSPVSVQYFGQGAVISGTDYYYVKDQLGSVAQLVTAGGSVATQYTYDPYGNRTTISGTVASDLGYASYFYHSGSGLDFAVYRAYDPEHARWLNRDPVGEAGGANLYAYVNGNPVNRVDALGLQDTAPGYVFPTFPYAPGTPENSALGNLLTQAASNFNNNMGYLGDAVGEGLYNALNNKPPQDATDPNGAKAPGLPGPEVGYDPPKGGPRWVPNPNPGRGGAPYGWEDKKGRVWCPTGKGSRAHGGPHWDVETPGGRNDNVYPPKGSPQ